MTATEQNNEIVRDYIDRLFTKGDLTAVDDYLAEDYVDHDPPFGTPGGREGMRGAAAMFREAFPDWHAEVGHLIAEGDLVCERFTASGGSPISCGAATPGWQLLSGQPRP